MVLKSILLKRDSESNWETNNPILGIGEPGLVYPTNDVRNPFKLKIGNGQDKWSDLPYFAEGCEYIVDLGKFSNSGAGESAAAQPDVYSNPKAVFIIYGLTGSDSRAIIEQSISASGTSYTTSQFLQLNGIKYCRKITYTKSSSGTISNSSVGSWKKVGDSDGIIFSRGSEVVNTSTEQTISGSKTFSSQIITKDIKVNNESVISSDIDPGELKVFPIGSNTNKGFIIRSANRSNNIPNVEILGTNMSQSYTYRFPTGSGGNVALGAKIDGVTKNADLSTGLIDLGNDFMTKSVIINGVVSQRNSDGSINLGNGFLKDIDLSYLNTEDISYSDLKNLYDGKNLVPGKQYRIIDYETKTAQVDTISAGKVFDIIVTAISNDKLDERASACYPKGNRANSGSSAVPGSLFIKQSSCDPFSWGTIEKSEYITNLISDYGAKNNISFGNYEIKADGFTVASTGGAVKIDISQRRGVEVICVGVELYKKSNLSVPFSANYEIKKISTGESNISYFLFGDESGVEYFVKLLFLKKEDVSSASLTVTIYDYYKPYYIGIDMSKWEIRYDIENNINKYSWADEENGKGVIYYLKDEWDNECHYDFKNIKFKRTKEWVDQYPELRDYNSGDLKFNETEKYFYTFNYNQSDDSLNQSGSYRCKQNRIGKYLTSSKRINLNNTIFLGNGNANNTIRDNNYNNVFGVNTYNNLIGDNFQNNVIYGRFSYNEIEIGFKNNVTKNLFNYNWVSHTAEKNVFAGYVQKSNFSTNIKNNVFAGGINCSILGNNISNCNFAGDILFSTIGDYFGIYYDSSSTGRLSNISTLTNVRIESNTVYSSTKTENIDFSALTLPDNSLISDGLSNTVDEDTIVLLRDSEGSYRIYKNSTILSEISSLEESLSKKQEELIPGTNIKTINGVSILGEGNIEIQGGGDFSGSAADINYVSEYAFGKDKTKRTIPAGTDLNTLDYGAWTSLDNTEYTNGDDSTNFGILVTRVGQAYKAQLMLGYRSSKLKFRSQYYIPETEGTPASIGWSNWEDVVFKSSLDDEVSGIVSSWAAENEVVYKTDLDSAVEDIINNSIPEAIENAITKTLNTEI